MSLTSKDVLEITRLLEDSSFTELQLEIDGMKLVLRRGDRGGPAEAVTAAAPPAVPAPPAPEPAPAAVAADDSAHAIPAPLLGTFYRAPKPGALPFIEPGSLVEADTVIGIIEVMKLMNAVRAGVRGRVSEILAADGELVEYGQTLARVLTTA